MSELALPPILPLTEPSSNIFAQREPSAVMTLKRRASPSLDPEEESSRKRLKEDRDIDGQTTGESDNAQSLDQSRWAEDMAQELQCGCCSELVYRPVIVLPCQHFFCGRYGFVSWIVNVLMSSSAAAVSFGFV